MTLTTEQLDAIATKLLGWKRARCPIHGDSCPEAYYHRTDGTQGHGWLDVDKPKAAMLVLEAMGEWCEKQDGSTWYVKVYSGCGWCCQIEQAGNDSADSYDVMVEGEPCDTPAAAIFACAAKLVERM